MAFDSTLRITIDSRDGMQKLRDLESRMDRAEQAGAGLARGMGLLKTAIGAAGAVVGGFTVSRVINEAAQFEDSMLGLQAVSGATASQMAELEDQARTLGATSAFSAQQAGQAQRFLAQAGFEINEVLSATPGILDLATAGQMNLAQAADIASNVLGGMRMEVDELNVVNDVLAATAGGSNTSISQLGQALSTAAPLAASAGVSIEETAAAIGTLSDAGIQAERAGTGLQGIFRQLSKVTPQAKEALAGYGLSLQDVNIEASGLGPVLEKLREANISTSDAFEIFGSEAGAAAQILIHGADRVGEFSEELENSEGAAREMALTIGSGLSGSMRSFNSALSESILQMGDSGLSSAFQTVTDTASGLLSVYNGMLPEFAEANDLTEDQERNLSRMAGALEVAAKSAAVFVGSRLAAYLASVAAAKLVATQQAIAYQAALARMAGVSRTAAAATATLRGALALLGGPVGVAVLAAGAVYTFREELGLTQQQAGLTTDEINRLKGEFEDLSDAALNNRIDELTADLQQAMLTAAAAREELARLRSEERGSGALGLGGGEVGREVRGMQALAEARARVKEIRQEIDVTREELGSRTFKTLGEWLFDVETNADGASTSVSKLADSSDDASKAAKEAARQAEQFASSLQSLEDHLFPVEAAQRQFRQEQIMLQTALMQGSIGIERYLEAWQRLQEAQRSQQDPSQAYGGQGFGSQIGQGGLGGMQERGSQWDRWLESAQNAFTDFDAMAANTAESFQRGFGNAFESMIFDSENFGDAMYNLLDGIARTLVRSLGEMAAQWLAYQAVQQMVGKNTSSLQSAGMISRAAAKQQEAALNAYAATAAIPVVGPALAPAAAGTAMASTAPFVAAISSLSAAGVVGQAHDGWDSLPRSGTYNLEKGERVTSASLNRDLTRFLDRENKAAASQERRTPSIGPTNITIHNNGRPMRVESAREREQDGERFLDLVVADIRGEGRTHDAMVQKYNLSPQGD